MNVLLSSSMLDRGCNTKKDCIKMLVTFFFNYFLWFCGEGGRTERKKLLPSPAFRVSRRLFCLILYFIYCNNIYLLTKLKSSIMNDETYSIPLRYRKMENLHIVFWLFKDISWCMIWRPLAIAMIIPTLLISIIIAFRTRQYMSEV